MKKRNKVIEELISLVDVDAPDYGPYLRTHFDRIAEDASLLSNSLSKDSRILDIGAVPPLLSSLLNEQGFSDITIADPNINLYSEYCANKSLKMLELDLLKEREPDISGEFDCVCFCEVMEHLTGPILYHLETVASYVKSGGYLYVTTPNLRSISGLVSIVGFGSGLAAKPRSSVSAQYLRANEANGYYGHVREYCSAEVIEVFESLGFELVTKSFQVRSRTFNRVDKIVQRLERLTPSWRLFGKYLFRKA